MFVCVCSGAEGAVEVAAGKRRELWKRRCRECVRYPCKRLSESRAALQQARVVCARGVILHCAWKEWSVEMSDVM